MIEGSSFFLIIDNVNWNILILKCEYMSELFQLKCRTNKHSSIDIKFIIINFEALSIIRI